MEDENEDCDTTVNAGNLKLSLKSVKGASFDNVFV